jgi:hypothetical protein
VANANEKEVTRLLQYLTMILMSMYGHRDLAKKATVQVGYFPSHFLSIWSLPSPGLA